MRPRVLSGIQPTGSPHIGNYLGALKNWAKIQYDYDSIYCIVDLHAVTVYQEPVELRAKIEELAGVLLAIGIDPTHSSLIVQSSIAGHAELAWMLTCVTPIGWLERMTQFKAKSEAQAINCPRPDAVSGADGRRHPYLSSRDCSRRRRSIPAPGADPRYRAALQL